MLMPAVDYQAISNGGVPYNPPVPPAAPIYHGTASLVATLQQQHSDRKKVYEEYRDLSLQIKTMMIQAIPLSFIRTLNHDQVGFANATPQQIMNHLLQTYGVITEDDLETNLKELKAPWNPAHDIEEIFARGSFCRSLATEGGDPITDATYTRALVTVFEESGVLETACEDWNKKPRADRTLVNCELHFIEANLHRLTKAAKDTKSVLSANEAVTNQPTKPSKDKTLAALVAEEVAKATKASKDKENEAPHEMQGLYYCWTHGICTHPGKNCKHKKEGHKDNATARERQGGSEFISIGPRRKTNK